MTEVVVQSLRIRGPAGPRLARIAARTLPTALEGALADIADLTLDSLTVQIPLDLADYDDDTIAIVWADAIREAVFARGGTRKSASAADASHTDVATLTGDLETGSSARTAVSAATAVAAVLHWLAAGADPRLTPREIVCLAEPALALTVARAVGPAALAQLTASLEGGNATGAAPRPSNPLDRYDPSRPASAAPLQEIPSQRRDATAWPQDSLSLAGNGTYPSPEAAPRVETDRAHALAQAAAHIGVLVATPDRSEADTINLAQLTHAAGLVLIYPWVADYLREAQRLHPHVESVALRTAALRILLTGAEDAVEDPLVSWLAGAPVTPSDRLGAGQYEAEPAGPRPAPLLERADDVRAAAEVVLGRFAALLPGFGASSPTFVRVQWLQRRGFLEAPGGTAELTAMSHPLDVVLEALPYPVTFLALPWTTPLSVRFVS